ncbi:MAG: ATP-binding protein [Candidatus Gracilibacteria bacterium]|nr:ATP-binding protein [Candidatus Gracilibacteria bacterium]
MELIYIDKLSKGHNKVDIINGLVVDGKISIEFIYKSKFENTKDLRDFVDIICDSLGFNDKIKSRIVLISDELNNNAIEYGSDLHGVNYLRINSFIDTESKLNFNLEVEDNGKGKSHKTALDMETMRAHKLKLGYFGHDSIRGRGLFLIIVQLVNRLYFRNSQTGGLIVGVKIKI